MPGNKEVFLSKRHNTQSFIKLLATYLEHANSEVEHAGEEGDADMISVRKALDLITKYQQVLVTADDTDVLILLLHHAGCSDEIFMESKQHIISIKVAKEVLGLETCLCLPFAHAMSGCATTSASFGMGKLKG